MSGPYTAGWPKRWDKLPATTEEEVQLVVPLSDAERMREALEEIRHTAKHDPANILAVIFERTEKK